jgi:nucleoside-diphosphate-sugar epimerase
MTSVRDWVLVTGATGFLGPALVYELASRGHRVLCLVRAEEPAEARVRVVKAMQPWTSDAERMLETGQLAVLRGDVHLSEAGLTGHVRTALHGRIAAIVHAAADTRFAAASSGEPERTNVTGTQRILALGAQLRCRDWHLISTAYVAGVTLEAFESAMPHEPVFRNDYERSKWRGERVARAAADSAGATLTIYRPSVVAGHSVTGRAARFTGIYYLFRATSLVARAAEQDPSIDLHTIPLRIPGSPHKCPNVVCIDDVAGAFGALFDQRSARGGVYHLTHPEPPSNAQIKRVLEDYYDIAGGRFVSEETGVGARPSSNRGAPGHLQELFDEMAGPMSAYLFDAPRFDRSQVRRFVQREPATWSDERLRRLIEAAEAAGWRSIGYDRQEAADAAELARYFQKFLPQKILQSKIGRTRQLAVSVRFSIGKRPEGQWWCRFEEGRVVAAEPAGDQRADVTYKTGESRFWAAAAGEITAAELFLSGEAQIEGDTERALKFAMILEEFVREFPYSREGRADPSERLSDRS